MQFKTPTALFLTGAMLFLCLTEIAQAAPTIDIPVVSRVGAGMATLSLKSNTAGTGYLTLLSGNNRSCGSGTHVKAGQDSTGAAARRFGSLALGAGSAGVVIPCVTQKKAPDIRSALPPQTLRDCRLSPPEST